VKRKYPMKPTGKKRKKTAKTAGHKSAAMNYESSKQERAWENSIKERQNQTKRQKSRVISNPYAVSSKSGAKPAPRGTDLYFESPSYLENADKQREYIKKRNAIRHKKKRKKRMIVFSAFLGLLILASSLTVCITLFFNIDSIEVKGESRYSDQEVLSHIDLQIGQNIFNFKKEEIEQQVLSALPYLESVALKRKLPTRVVVEVEPVLITNAIWLENEDRYLLLSQSGRAVDVAAEVSEEIPRVKGVEVDSYEIGKRVAYKTGESSQSMIDIAQAMQKYGLTELSTLDVSDKYSLRIIYNNRFIIELGSSSNLEYKVKFAATMMEDEEKKGSAYGTINVSNCVSGVGSFLDKTYSEFLYEAYGETDNSEPVSSEEPGSSGEPETSSEPDTANE